RQIRKKKMFNFDNNAPKKANRKSVDDHPYGKCSTCNGYNTLGGWCQSCDPQSLTLGWSSKNSEIDEIIKSTQLQAKEYDNSHYLQWIPYEEFKDIEKIGEGGFATIYKARWVGGEKYID